MRKAALYRGNLWLIESDYHYLAKYFCAILHSCVCPVSLFRCSFVAYPEGCGGDNPSANGQGGEALARGNPGVILQSAITVIKIFDIGLPCNM